MLTKEEKLDMVLNHFDRESDVEHAMCLLDDYERVVAKKQQEVSAGITQEQRRLVGVIADKIEDGTLFQSGIYSKKDLARFVRNMLDAVPTRAHQPVHSIGVKDISAAMQDDHSLIQQMLNALESIELAASSESAEIMGKAAIAAARARLGEGGEV